MATKTLNRLLILLLLLLLHTQPALSASAPASSPSISPSSSSSPPPPPPPPPPASSSSGPSNPTPAAPPTEKSSPSSPSALDPKQLMALKSLGVPASSDPCSPSAAIATCDSSTPFRHVVSLRLANCSSDMQMSPTALKTLSSISSLSFVDCPFDPVHLPEELSSNLRSFSCVRSLHRLTGVWLSRLGNVTVLDVRDVLINASGPTIILSKMEDLRSLRISGTNLTGFLPKKWPPKITDIDLSNNNLKGSIPTTITLLSDLKSLNLSSNKLTGTIPSTIGDLLTLQNISLAANSLQGSLPDSLLTIPSLIHLDLSSNQLNGSIPKFLAKMKSLKYLNLENNEFQGIFPFNASFISTMTVFRIGGNSNLCYNTSAWSSKIKLGISPCDKNGLPIVPPDSSNSPASAPGNDDDNAADSSSKDRSSNQHHGPSTVVLVVAIGLSTIVFLIVFCILLSRWCS